MRANRSVGGVDRVTIGAFEKSLDKNIAGDIVIDWVVSGANSEILSSYEGVLRIVCGMEWTDGDDGRSVPCGFLVWPKRGER